MSQEVIMILRPQQNAWKSSYNDLLDIDNNHKNVDRTTFLEPPPKIIFLSAVEYVEIEESSHECINSCSTFKICINNAR